MVNNLYLLILPIKLKTKNSIIASNHLVLYTKIRAVSVLYSFSIKVAIPITAAKTMNRTAINFVDDKNDIILLIVNSCCVLRNCTKILKLNGAVSILTLFKQRTCLNFKCCFITNNMFRDVKFC